MNSAMKLFPTYNRKHMNENCLLKDHHILLYDPILNDPCYTLTSEICMFATFQGWN